MSVPNAYPKKEELKYHKTVADIPDLIIKLKSFNVPLEVKRASYVIFRVESRDGRSGINNNYAGLQADGDPWPSMYDPLIEGTCVIGENGTGNPRRFLCFGSFEKFLTMYVDRLYKRGLYIGGQTYFKVKMSVKTPEDLCRAYVKDWVSGDAKVEPSADKLKNFNTYYKLAEAVFPNQ
jgi:hypothetical protein